jgi:hypothetical protein
MDLTLGIAIGSSIQIALFRGAGLSDSEPFYRPALDGPGVYAG